MRSVRSISLASTTAAVAALSMSAPATAGLEAIVTPGYGSAGDKSPVTAESSSIGEEIWAGAAKPYGAGPIVDGAIGYRPLPFLSFGMTGGLRRSGASSVSGRSTYPNPRRQGLQIGIYVRGYLPLVGSESGSLLSSTGTRYDSDAQAPRSISLQRSEQKGRNLLAGSHADSAPHCGQRTVNVPLAI